MGLFHRHEWKKIGKFYATGRWNYGYPVHLYTVQECACGKTKNISVSNTLCHGFDDYFDFTQSVEKLGYELKRIVEAKLEKRL